MIYIVAKPDLTLNNKQNKNESFIIQFNIQHLHYAN